MNPVRKTPDPRSTRLDEKPSDTLMRVDDLTVTYHTRRGTITALQNLNMAQKAGEFVALLGPSGCGKSTLLKVAAGLLAPSSGQVLINHTPVTKPRRDVGVVFQKANLLPWKTVLDNVLVGPRALGLDPKESRERAQALLDTVGLGGFAENYPQELSGGMQQRVGLVRALVHDPSVLLMDEPFAALDAMTREHMTLELQNLWLRTDKSVVFITHSIPEAVFLADRVIVLSGRPGRVIDELTVDIARPRTLDTMASGPFGQYCNRLREHFRNEIGV